MTKEEAVENLQVVLDTVACTKKDHAKLDESLKTLIALATPKEATPTT